MTRRYQILLLVILAYALSGDATRITAASWSSAPPLPAPTGPVIHVATEPQLQAAVFAVTSGGTILIAPGVYHLTSTLNIGNRPLSNIAIRGESNNRDDVVLVGPGMTNPNYGNAPHGIWTGNGVSGILIANLTVRDFYFHPLILNGGTAAPHVYNVRLNDGGQQLLKQNPDTSGKGIDNGIVEYSVFDFTTTSRDYYTNGVDLFNGSGWIIRHNLFRNIRAPAGQLAGPSILAWRGARDTIVEGNTFIDCQREIAFGLEPTTPNDHYGGIIRNNFIVRTQSFNGDAAINVDDSPDTQVLHNTILISGTFYPNAIEYRFPDTTGVSIVNNLVDAEIRSRDGATATLLNNITSATRSMFVAPALGDLHLLPSATAAIDTGVAVSGASTDWDGDPRPTGAAPDIGADELGAGGVPPAPYNVALSSNGATATASSTYGPGYEPSGAINGDRAGLNWGAGGGWNDAAPFGFPDWVEIQFNATYSISQINVFGVQDTYWAAVQPTNSLTSTQYGLVSFDVQYWTGSAWAVVPGGSITGNTLVWRAISFSPIATSKIRLLITGTHDGWSRVTEIEALTSSSPPPPPSGSVNVASSASGATATASSTYGPGYEPSGAINSDRAGINWGAGGGWNNAMPFGFPDWVEIQFNATYSISQINVFGVQDTYWAPVQPDGSLTSTQYGLVSFDVQYWTGSAWAVVPGGSITGNTLVWRAISFSPIATSKIRLLITGTRDGWSRVTEIEALTGGD